jgi:hypothetical protein
MCQDKGFIIPNARTLCAFFRKEFAQIAEAGRQEAKVTWRQWFGAAA